MATADPKGATRPAAPQAVKPAAPKPAPAPEDDSMEVSGPVIERISIGSLVVEKTIYDDGEQEIAEMRTVKKGPDEKFKSWRHAQPL
jgi:hypothetical protein